MNKTKLNVTTKSVTVADPSLASLREEVRAKLPDHGAIGAVSPAAARKALVEAIQSLSDEDLRNFRGGQITIAS